MIERAASAVTLRPATPATAERIAALLTDEGYPPGQPILPRTSRRSPLGGVACGGRARSF